MFIKLIRGAFFLSSSIFSHFYLGKCSNLSLCLSTYPHHNLSIFLSLSLPFTPPSPLWSVSLSISLSLPELTTQEVTTDSINSSYINPAIIAPSACLSTPRPPLTSFLLLTPFTNTLFMHPFPFLFVSPLLHVFKMKKLMVIPFYNHLIFDT